MQFLGVVGFKRSTLTVDCLTSWLFYKKTENKFKFVRPLCRGLISPSILLIATVFTKQIYKRLPSKLQPKDWCNCWKCILKFVFIRLNFVYFTVRSTWSWSPSNRCRRQGWLVCASPRCTCVPLSCRIRLVSTGSESSPPGWHPSSGCWSCRCPHGWRGSLGFPGPGWQCPTSQSHTPKGHRAPAPPLV